MLDRKLLKQIDWVTIVLVLALVAIGLISIASIMASPFDGDEASVSDYLAKLNLNYVQRQGVNFLVGIAAFLIVIVFDYSFFKLLIKYAYIGNVALLLILFTVEKTRGIAGWFVFEAIDRAIQPAELCKVCIIIFLAKIVSEGMDQDHGRLRSFKSILFALAVCGLPTVLVMLQPDFGTAFVYICILVFILFIAPRMPPCKRAMLPVGNRLLRQTAPVSCAGPTPLRRAPPFPAGLHTGHRTGLPAERAPAVQNIPWAFCIPPVGCIKPPSAAKLCLVRGTPPRTENRKEIIHYGNRKPQQ